MTDNCYPMGFEDLWRQVRVDGWTCGVRSDATVQILAEGVEMSFAAVPTDDPEAFGLAAVVGSPEGLPDGGRLCEEALAWNAGHRTTLALVGETPKLRVALCARGGHALDPAHLREAIREVAETARIWKDKLERAQIA